MALKVFSKRHPDAGKSVCLSQAVRQRIWYTLKDCDPFYDPNSMYSDSTLCFDTLPARLKKEHGWQEFRAYKSQTEWDVLISFGEFLLRGIPRFVLDSTELFYDLLMEEKTQGRAFADLMDYQSRLNTIFEDAIPWRMLDGRISSRGFEMVGGGNTFKSC